MNTFDINSDWGSYPSISAVAPPSDITWNPNLEQFQQAAPAQQAPDIGSFLNYLLMSRLLNKGGGKSSQGRGGGGGGAMGGFLGSFL